MRLGARRTLDHLDLKLVADGRHSVPTEIVLTNREGESRRVAVAVPPDQSVPNGTVDVVAEFPALSADELSFRISQVRPVLTVEYDCGCEVETPAAIAELGIPDLAPVVPPELLGRECRTDLLEIDGQPVPARLSGSTAAAVALAPIHLVQCDSAGSRLVVPLKSGRHVTRTGPGDVTGIDVDRLVWASAADGSAARTLSTTGTIDPAPRAIAPRVRIARTGRSTMTAQISGAENPFWLVLGQSQNAGWEASVDGRPIGGSRLVDGYANGWRIRSEHRNVTVDLEWIPQRTVERSIALSIAAIMACLGIVLVSARRSRQGSTVLIATPEQLPKLVMPWHGSPPPVGVVITIVVSVLLGAFAATVASPAIGVVLALVVAASLVRPRLRVGLALLPAAAIAAVGAYIAIRQARHHLPPIFEWPTFFFRARTLGWIVIVSLAANAVIALVVDRRA